MPLRDISLLDVQQYLSSLSGSDGSKALATNAIKSLISFTSELGYTRVNVGKGIKSPKVRDKLANRILSEADVIRMIDRSQGRDRVILHLLYHAGLRVSELVSLKWENVHESKDGAVLDVWGKGEKQRYIPISKAMYEELNALPGRFLGADRYVFQSRKGKAGTQPLDVRQINRIVLEAAKRAGIPGNVSPHWLRHSNASHSLDNGAPIHVVQQSLGHTSLLTTQKYLHVKPGSGSSQYLKVEARK